ncbi:MAG TPA: Dabb family protein [Lacipirellulaceae bacterium]|jgi:hypothetical protein|nr:Dabb family protein [Lacipirellulaceae bacterium]
MHVGNSNVIVLCLLSVLSSATAIQAEDAKEPEKVLRHAVFFKFKDGTSDEDIKKVVDAFDALPKKIDSIKGYERGKNFSPIGFDDGYTHCFLVTFADEAGRAKYLPHPDHEAFKKLAGPHFDKVFVIDFWGKPEKDPKEREIKHMLFLKYKEGATAEEIKDVEAAIVKLASNNKGVRSFEWGKNNSPETHDEGFTDAFIMTFEDVEALKKYADSSEHQAVVERIIAASSAGRVLDFWTKDAAAK